MQVRPVLMALMSALWLAVAGVQAFENAPPPPKPEGEPAQGATVDDVWGDEPGARMGGKRPAGPGQMRGGPPHEITAEQMEEALAVLRDFRPDLASRIEEWRREDPTRVGRMIAHQLPGIRRLVEARRSDPDGYKLRLRDMQLERQTRQLGQQIAEARRGNDAAKVNDLTRDLRASVVEHFNVRQQMRERAVVMLQQRIDELRQQLQAREKARDQLIEQQVERLIPNEQSDRNAEW